MPPVEGQWQSDPLLSSQSAFLKTRRKPQTLSFAISPSQQALHKELPRLACNDLRSEANLLVALYYNLLLLAPCHWDLLKAVLRATKANWAGGGQACSLGKCLWNAFVTMNYNTPSAHLTVPLCPLGMQIRTPHTPGSKNHPGPQGKGGSLCSSVVARHNGELHSTGQQE